MTLFIGFSLLYRFLQ